MNCNQCNEKKEVYCFKKVFDPVIKKRIRMKVCKTCVKKNKLKNNESEPESNIGYFSDGGTYHDYDVVDN